MGEKIYERPFEVILTSVQWCLVLFSVTEGEDERAGRWAGTGKKECGLHIMEQEGGSGI